jgi:hypothetical protein
MSNRRNENYHDIPFPIINDEECDVTSSLMSIPPVNLLQNKSTFNSAPNALPPFEIGGLKPTSTLNTSYNYETLHNDETSPICRARYPMTSPFDNEKKSSIQSDVCISRYPCIITSSISDPVPSVPVPNPIPVPPPVPNPIPVPPPTPVPIPRTSFNKKKTQVSTDQEFSLQKKKKQKKTPQASINKSTQAQDSNNKAVFDPFSRTIKRPTPPQTLPRKVGDCQIISPEETKFPYNITLNNAHG